MLKPDGTGERVLTEGFHNEGPTFAPNGQYVLFFRDPGGQGGGKLFMVDITGKVEQPVPTPVLRVRPDLVAAAGGALTVAAPGVRPARLAPADRREGAVG